MNTVVRFFYQKDGKNKFIITELDPAVINNDFQPYLYTTAGSFLKKYIKEIEYVYPETED